jgi:hypothetical protein
LDVFWNCEITRREKRRIRPWPAAEAGAKDRPTADVALIMAGLCTR